MYIKASAVCKVAKKALEQGSTKCLVYGLNLHLLYLISQGPYHPEYINLLKPDGHVMHQQFNIQQLYALPTLYLCFVFI